MGPKHLTGLGGARYVQVMEITPVTLSSSQPPQGSHATTEGLRAGTIGLMGAITLGVVMLSPAMALYGVFGPSFLAAGKAAPLAFVWALLATLPTAVSYVALTSQYPLSGSAASWIGLVAPRPIAIWCGWMVFFYYLTNFIIQPVTLGVFMSDAFGLLGAQSNLMSYFIGAIVCIALPAWTVYRGIAPSIHGALGVLLFEAAIVIALCLTVLMQGWQQGVNLDLTGFHLSASADGASGIFRAMIFGMLAFCGFDVISTLAEETHMAKKLIPRATLLALFLFAAIIIFGVWTLTFGAEHETLRAVAKAGRMPISEIAHRAWGRGAGLVSITAITAALGLAIATSVGASRILLSLAREKSAPILFSAIHKTWRVPWNALHLIFAIGLVAAICSGFAIGPYQSYVWWGTTSTFFAMLTYMMVHTANIALYIARKPKTNAPTTSSKTLQEWLLHLVVPITGLVINGYLLIRSFFIELWLQDWATGKSIVLFDSGCALVVAGVVWWNRETSTEQRNEPSIRSATSPSQNFSIETPQAP